MAQYFHAYRCGAAGLLAPRGALSPLRPAPPSAPGPGSSSPPRTDPTRPDQISPDQIRSDQIKLDLVSLPICHRIDHILGFCRIWEVPGHCATGAMHGGGIFVSWLGRSLLHGHGGGAGSDGRESRRTMTRAARVPRSVHALRTLRGPQHRLLRTAFTSIPLPLCQASWATSAPATPSLGGSWRAAACATWSG